jgi:hypothetical protein
MANISFLEFANRKSNPSKQNKEYKVNYFSLKDDGDSAIVRFAHSSVKDFDILTVHTVKTTTKDGKEIYKRVSCLREPGQPASVCPLCTSNNKTISKVVNKFYVKLIEYVEENGKKVPKARVWERPAEFANELKSFMDVNGDLKNVLFMVTRNGVRGSTSTKYNIVTIPETSPIYKPEFHVKDFSDFEGFKLEGSFYLVKTAEEINTFLKTGEFPRTESSIQKNSTYSRPATPSYDDTQEVTQPQPSEQPKPSSQPNPVEGRPQRYKF